MELLDKFRRKTVGLSNSEIAKEVTRKLSAGLVERYRYMKTKLLPAEITDQKLMRALSLTVTSDLLLHFQQRPQPLIYPGLQNLVDTTQIYANYFPTGMEDILRQANAICDHTFVFLGNKNVYGQEIAWHYDPVVDYQWPQCHYTQIDLASAKGQADVKNVWELARLQHFVTLGQAYSITEDERYAIEFIDQLFSFARANPPQVGVHWLCAMEVALRAISLSLSFYFFSLSPNFSLEVLTTLLKLLLSHALFIEQNLEFSYRITSNHYLSDLAGLLFIGTLFPEFNRAKHWQEFALSELLKEMDKQIYADGVDWEASTAYHAFVLEIYLYSFLLCKQQGIEIENRYWQKLEKMFKFVRAYLKPDGMAPLIGDCDDGHVILWRRRLACDHSYLLSIGAVLFDNEQFKTTGQPSEECLWLFGAAGWDSFESMALNKDQIGSAAFSESGIYIQRDGNLYTIIDCGEIGINGNGSHAHNDLLSFELYYRARTFFVDAGSYVYTGDPQARNEFRATAYHNTVMVDHTEINDIDPEQLFVLANQAKPLVHRWESTQEYDLLDAEHNGYMRLAAGVVHRRQVYLNKVEGYWLIYDLLMGEGEHTFSFFFNFDWGLTVEIVEGNHTIITDEDLGLCLALVPLDNADLVVAVVERYVSKGYGQRLNSYGVIYNLNASAPVKQRFLIVPCPPGDLSPVNDLIKSLSPYISARSEGID